MNFAATLGGLITFGTKALQEYKGFSDILSVTPDKEAEEADNEWWGNSLVSCCFEPSQPQRNRAVS